jgi:integrase
MRGVFLRNPPTKNLLIPWDVNVVLRFLEGEPFEPLVKASLHALTFKTVFLVALTSVRRCSEIQALGRNAPYIQIEDGLVRLRTVAGFLPKTATPCHLGGDIVLPVNESNKKLCVVRCLKRYLKVTQSLMTQHNVEHNHVFVCYGHKNKCKPVSKRTLSGWLVKIIKAAYAAAGKTLESKVKAHSTRAQAATWAVFKGASVEEVMKAADWRQKSTFIKHYALDVWKRQQGTVGQRILENH